MIHWSASSVTGHLTLDLLISRSLCLATTSNFLSSSTTGFSTTANLPEKTRLPTPRAPIMARRVDPLLRATPPYEFESHKTKILCKAAAHDHGTVDFDGFPPELKDIMYEYMHLQVVEEASHQLKYRYNPAPSCLQKVSKKFAEASNKRIPHGQIRNFEITQRNLVFPPEEQQFFFTKSQAGPWTDSTYLTLNFNINNGTPDGKFEDTLVDLLCWIRRIIDKWHDRRGGNTPRVESDVTVRFWLCSMEAYVKFYPLINREWELIDDYKDCGIVSAIAQGSRRGFTSTKTTSRSQTRLVLLRSRS